MTESAIKTQNAPVDLAALDGFEQLHAILDGHLPPAPIASVPLLTMGPVSVPRLPLLPPSPICKVPALTLVGPA